MMKNYTSSDIRNCAIVGHASSGKTMLTESMLASASVITRLGSIAAGTTVSDYRENERERKISIQLSVIHFPWLNKKINVLDTPGYMDFISEALSGLRVADLAIIVVDAKDGVGVGTHQVWEWASQYQIPKVFVISGLDKENADFTARVQEIKETFSDKVFPLTEPLDPGPGFSKLLDVMRSEVIEYAPDQTGKYTESPASGELAERVKTLHQQLIELVAEADDSLLEKFFEKGSLSEEELRAGLKHAFLNQSFIPVFGVSGQTNVGVARLLDFIAKYGPSPLDRPATKAIDMSDNEVSVEVTNPEPSLFVFKTTIEPKFGELTIFRVYSGTVQTGMELFNADKRVSEKIGQMFFLNGQNRILTDRVVAGDIAATVKLRDTHTGNTLSSYKLQVRFPKVQYPHPNIHAALELANKGDEEKLSQGLAALQEVDPTFHYIVDAELRQTIISGQGELHLAVIVDELKRRYKVEVQLTQPRVRYRETIKGKTEAKYRHKKQTGGAGQFAEVWLRVEPAPRDSGIQFTESLVGQNVDRVFVPSVEKGVMRAANEGVIAGYRVTDVKVDFYDGKMHPVDSNDISFQIAGYYAFREAIMNANPCILEPIHLLEVKVPEEYMGAVMGDLTSRRGKILGMESLGKMQVIKALVPAAELYRYSTTLRSLTGGRGSHTERFSHYEEMPAALQQKVIEEAKKLREQQHK